MTDKPQDGHHGKQAQHTPGPWKLRYEDDGDGLPYAMIVAGEGLHSEGGFKCDGIMSRADAHLLVAAPDLLRALDGLVMVCGRTGDSLEDFEEQAALFYKETRMMRPGKDIGALSDDRTTHNERREAYNAWVEGKINAARVAVNAATSGQITSEADQQNSEAIVPEPFPSSSWHGG